jgi:tetratricopeptide (TPR) repeat protein
MVKGHYALAMEYLTILERTLFHRAYARQYKALLADAKARDLHFAEQRSRLPTAELADMAMAGFISPLTLLESDPHNRMAFDYLMAWCLLDRQMLPMLPRYVGGLNAAGYRSIPVHLQETLLAVETITGHSAVPPGFNCDPATAARFNSFMGQIEQYPDKLAAQRALRPAFSDTYMYYSAFVAAPVTRKGALAYWWLANGFRALGRTDEAIAHYQHALWLDPAFAEAHAALADMLKSQGHLEEAAYHLSEARRLKASAPNAAKPMYSAGSSRVE